MTHSRTLRGEGVSVILAWQDDHDAIHYTLDGQGISPDQGIFPQQEPALLLDILLAPLALRAEGDRIVSAIA